jgi:hypothetical protein
MNQKNDCAAIRELMLEAELDELRGIGGGDVANHIRECASCAAYAQSILRSYGQLDAGLTGMSTQTAPATVIPMQSRRRLRWIPVPLAAAAVIALLMVRRQDETMPNVDAVARMMIRETPVVSPAPGQQALVMEKNEMTIVWLYKQEIQ